MSTAQVGIPRKVAAGWLVPDELFPEYDFFVTVNGDMVRCSCWEFRKTIPSDDCRHIQAVTHLRSNR
jgi:hypothetical protein